MPGAGGGPLTIAEAAARLSAEYPGLRPETLRALEERGLVVPERNAAGFRRYCESDLTAVRRALSGPPRRRNRQLADEDVYEADSVFDVYPVYEARGYEADPWEKDAPDESAAESAEAESRRGDLAHDRGRTAPAAVSASAAAPCAPDAPPSPARAAQPAQAAAKASLPGARRHGAGTTPEPGAAASAVPTASEAPTPPPRVPPSAATGSGLPDPVPAVGPITRRLARWPEPDYFAPDLGEVTLGREGLTRATGLADEWIDALVAFDLISGRTPATGADLLVARAAAELLGYGLEPRHLRPMAQAAERAAALLRAARGGSSRSGTAQAAAALVRLEAALLRAALLDD